MTLAECFVFMTAAEASFSCRLEHCVRLRERVTLWYLAFPFHLPSAVLNLRVLSLSGKLLSLKIFAF